MERRKFVVGLGALAAGSSAAVGTGALNAFEADRDATIEVVDDTDAYIQLLPGDRADGNTESGGYAEINDDGELEIVIDRLNANATSKFDNVFRVKNNIDSSDVDYGGDPEFDLQFELSGSDADAVTVLGYDGLGDDEVVRATDDESYDLNLPGGGGDSKVLAFGDVMQIDLQIDTTDVDLSGEDETEQIVDTLTVSAQEPEANELV